MVNGNVNEGFLRTLDKYILDALVDTDHGYVYLFTMFLAYVILSSCVS
jgi:hypothetical protein